MTERETRRLLLRQWQAEDFEAYAAYYADEKTARWVGGLLDRDKAWRRLASELGHWTYICDQLAMSRLPRSDRIGAGCPHRRPRRTRQSRGA